MWIERHIAPTVQKAFSQFPVLVLTGARQAGKTSLVRRLFPQADYASFDVLREAETARLDPAGFLAQHREPLIIDQVQYVPSILRNLKVAVDQRRQPKSMIQAPPLTSYQIIAGRRVERASLYAQPPTMPGDQPQLGRFLLTGSQDFLLMQGVSESLAGRCAVLSLPTLSLAEACPSGANRDADGFCWRSGFPELWQRPELERDLWLGSYLATYLERDVRNILNVGSLRDFDRFLRAAAARAGQLLSLSDLARDVGVAPNTAKNWLSVLEASQQVFLLEPYHRSATKRLVKSPKLYFADTGLLLYLMGFPNWPAVVQNAAWGAVWENLVISEARKHFLNLGRRPPLWFWRTAQGKEVDLLIETGPASFLAVECKAAAEPSSRELAGFAAVEAAYGLKACQAGAIVCRTEQPYPLKPQNAVAALPLGGHNGLSAWLRRNCGR